MGDDDFPYWLMSVRVNILLFLLCLVAALLWWTLFRVRARHERGPIAIVVVLTLLAAVLRFAVAGGNLLDFGGIPYSRLLLGYRGHFATAQFYSIFYELTARDIEHAILFNRIAGTLTIPIVYVLCAVWQERRTWFPVIAALLFAVSPLHILFSASDSLAVFSVFITATSYALMLAAAQATAYPRVQFLLYLGGFSGLVLSTQVRYENGLFLIPAGLYLLFGGRRQEWPRLLPAAAIAFSFLAFDLIQAASAGLSFQTPLRPTFAAAMVLDHVILNPFVGIGLLAVSGTAAALSSPVLWAWIVPLVWAVALGLSLLAESGHGAARVIASWLVLILPCSAFGLAHWLRSRWQALRAAGVAVLFCLAVQPLLFSDVLAGVHLEMQEHRFFKEAVRNLPAGIDVMVVPDDELLRRRAGSTVELVTKYSMTLARLDDRAAALRLVGLTDFLERPDESGCRPPSCAFYFGLPCTPQQVYPFTRDQCLAMQQSRALVPIVEERLTGAPFVACSIYAGRLHEKLCVPATIARTIGLYRVGAAGRDGGRGEGGDG